MKKRVNGQIVDITNIELFKMGYEGLLLNKKATSRVEDTIEDKGLIVKQAVGYYKDYLDKLVFPLNMIEDPIKYVMLGELLQNSLNIPVIVTDGLVIPLSQTVQLKLVAGTWSIEPRSDKLAEYEEDIDLEDHKDAIGYKEYSWAYTRLRDGEGTQDFYSIFMPDFIAACNNKMIIVKWELARILDFGTIPKKKDFIANRVEKEDGNYYTIDIYKMGQRPTEQKTYTITAKGIQEGNEIKDVYGFDVYEKSNRTAKVSGPEGLTGVFDAILLNGMTDKGLKEIPYKGFVTDNNLILEVNNNIYIADLYQYQGIKKLISNVSLFAKEHSRLYVKKRNKLASGIFEDTLYSYDLIDGKVRLCQISFSAK